jgi:hypothetical protein
MDSYLGGVLENTLGATDMQLKQRNLAVVDANTDSRIYQFTIENQVLDYVKTALRNTLLADEERMGLPQKVSSVQFVTASLHRHLERLLNLEDEVGLIDASDTDKPHLMDKAIGLQREHELIRRMLNDLTQASHELDPTEEHYFRAYCRNAVHFLDKLDLHERAEMHMLHQLYNDDTGGEG